MKTAKAALVNDKKPAKAKVDVKSTLEQVVGTIVQFRQRIKEAEKQLRELRAELRTTIKDRTGDVVKRLEDMPIRLAKQACQDLYWQDETIAGLMRAAYKQVFGSVLVITPVDMSIDCERCGEETTVTVKSWDDFNKKQRYGKICADCKKAVKREYSSENEDDENDTKSSAKADYDDIIIKKAVNE